MHLRVCDCIIIHSRLHTIAPKQDVWEIIKIIATCIVVWMWVDVVILEKLLGISLMNLHLKFTFL